MDKETICGILAFVLLFAIGIGVGFLIDKYNCELNHFFSKSDGDYCSKCGKCYYVYCPVCGRSFIEFPAFCPGCGHNFN